jgi:energy-coupling factor transporter transmembrane protein EcfT
MKKIAKYFLYAVITLLMFLVLASFYLLNLILVGLLGFLIFTIETRRFSSKIKVIVIIAVIVLALIYLWYPKKITTCGVLPGTVSCSSLTCQGLPFHGLNVSVCLGKSVNK